MPFVEADRLYAEYRKPGRDGRATESAMTTTLILAATALAMTAMVCAAASRAWGGWLDLKRLELASQPPAPSAAEAAEDEIGRRIELAAVRERLKKLETIAAGVEL
jgi:hypothetical protein